MNGFSIAFNNISDPIVSSPSQTNWWEYLIPFIVILIIEIIAELISNLIIHG